MFSVTLKLLRTTCTVAAQIRQLCPNKSWPLNTNAIIAIPISSTLLRCNFCSLIVGHGVATPHHDIKLARRKRDGGGGRCYWHNIRKRFQTTDASKSPSKKTKKQNQTMADGRCWESTATASGVAKGAEITVMSYNILAQHLLNEHLSLYQQHVRQHLDWQHRLNLIVRHIAAIAPQVLCLQEVQRCHLDELSKRLAGLGLDQHVFKKRTSDDSKDGCAIFYPSKSLQLIEFHRVEFFQPKVKLLDRHNVAVLAKFTAHDKPDVVFCVCTTHLLFNPKREDVRLAQIQVLLAEIDRFSYLHRRGPSGKLVYAPVILTGDFNTQPTSATFRLLSTGKVNYSELAGSRLQDTNRNVPNIHPAAYGPQLLPPSLGITDACQHITFAKFNTTKTTWLFNSDDSHVCREAPDHRHLRDIPFGTGTLRHKLSFGCVYANVDTATTVHDSWTTVDYIFYSRRYVSASDCMEEGNLRLVARYRLPTVAACCAMGHIPNADYGSDHISLAAKFVVMPTERDDVQ